ncbi:MAG: hypothetical protein O9264_10325 [Leptospira sp.]|jgi:hypothetical protein|nr:hypothetical protein [Leptospira sp.]
MLYAAIAMIVVGILCFLYVSLSPNSSQSSTSPRRTSPERNPSFQGYSANFRHNPQQAVSASLDERIRRDREIADNRPEWREPTIRDLKPSVPPPAIIEKTAVLKDMEDGFEEVSPVIEPKVHSFHMEGILYMDHSGKIPFGQKELLPNDSNDEVLRSFKRVGPAKLKEEDGKFVFYSGNASYTYMSYELEQVVFYDQGVAFVLKDPKTPRPVYFTKEMDELKEFLSQATAEA